ncbi:MAG: 50S ribosomal protein L10 [Mycoplasmataceae bacterium]|jgi:large subunit ribosomal protein L10|nr:50S ribosomal protein L10 [Mycoplasmataceae bacterium]
MSKIIQNKINKVDEISKEISSAKSIVIFEYLGLTAQKISELRRKLHDANAKMYVCKNNIFNRSIQKNNIEGINELKGPTAIIISKGDEILAFKEINELMKDFKFINYKSGILDGNIVGIDKLSTIASLPNKDGLISMLLSVLTASIRNFAYGISEVSKLKN